MSDCPQEKLHSALDRFQEAHFWIHGMRDYYHHASQFRWHLNAFLRALKEIPDLIRMGMQNEVGFKSWFQEQWQDLRSDPLIKDLFKKRDIVVHQQMLLPQSKGTVGITEGRGFKMAMNATFPPWQDSDEAILQYAVQFREFDFLGLVTPDEDSIPCVYREWRLPEFDDEVVELCSRSLLRIGEVINAVIGWQGAEPTPVSLDCRHAEEQVKWKLYDRSTLIKQVRDAVN